jgi:hypothetical protein
MSPGARMRRHSSGRHSLAGNGEHISEYDPVVSEAILGEAAHLMRHLGFAGNHAILIGGLVPGLLVLDPGSGRPIHIGTTDIDVCLSVALIEGDTAEYERIEAALKKAGYTATDSTFCWKNTRRPGLKVEFFCPANQNRPSGTLFRPKAVDDPTVKHNMGSSLSAIALDAGEVISADAQTIEHDVTLPDGAGVVRQAFRVSGIVGFLVAKVGALLGRNKPKDAYDIVWLLEAWEGGPEGAAAAVRDSPIFEREDVQAALGRLTLEFGDVGRIGPISYARFTVLADASQDEMDRAARQAVGAVRTFIQTLALLR